MPKAGKNANHATWLTLSRGTRLVTDGAANLDSVTAGEDANTNIRAVAAALSAGARYAPLIAVDGPNGALILVEGHTRATAYILAGVEPIEIIVGSSPTMSRWAFY